jgi:CubicO group peptidase (beta-lactamase class C family)
VPHTFIKRILSAALIAGLCSIPEPDCGRALALDKKSGLGQETTNLASCNQIATRINKVIDKALAEKRIVGTVVVVAQDGRVIYKRAAGLADRENQKPMKQDSIFQLASMTKTIVSAAALKLIEEKKLKLDDPVTKFLPDFKPKLADGSTPTILGLAAAEPHIGPRLWLCRKERRPLSPGERYPMASISPV